MDPTTRYMDILLTISGNWPFDSGDYLLTNPGLEPWLQGHYDPYAQSTDYSESVTIDPPQLPVPDVNWIGYGADTSEGTSVAVNPLDHSYVVVWQNDPNSSGNAGVVVFENE